MRKLITALLVATLSVPAAAQVKVRGYYRSNGTYVQPHYRSSPDRSIYNNYSTRGNINPYTGQVGTRDPYSPYPSPSYRSPYSNYGTSGPHDSRSDDDADPQ